MAGRRELPGRGGGGGGFAGRALLLLYCASERGLRVLFVCVANVCEGR